MEVNPIFTTRNLYAFGGEYSQSAIDYIHPLRQKDVQKILNNVPESVELIIVYGSSLGDFVRDDSDLDLAIVSEDSRSYNRQVVKALNLDSELDVVVFASEEDLITQAEGLFPVAVKIVKQGLPIYYQGKEVILL